MELEFGDMYKLDAQNTMFEEDPMLAKMNYVKMCLANFLSFNDLAEHDFDEIVKFLAKNFSTREPLTTVISAVPHETILAQDHYISSIQSSMLHLTYKDYKEILPGAVPTWIQDGVSVIVRDGNSNKIVGCAMAAILTPKNAAFFDGVFKPINSKIEHFNIILEVLESSVNLFRKYDVDTILDIAMITVDPSFAGNGIGKRLVSECERRGLALGCQMATAQATNVSSQQLFLKIGYLTDAEIDYDSLKIHGQQVLDNKRSLGTYSAKIVARRLVK